MRTSNKGKVEIIGHEGICLSKYLDSVGVWTIGAGATRTEISDIAKWPLDKKITMQEAFELFGKSLGKYEDAINKCLTRDISQTQFDALVSWCYNVGVGWVKKASVIRLLNMGGASPATLRNALLMYNKPKEIIGRRTKEADLLVSGVYSNNGKALLFPVSSSGHPIYSRGTTINVWEYIDQSSEAQPKTPLVSRSEEKELESAPSLLKRGISMLKDMFSKK